MKLFVTLKPMIQRLDFGETSKTRDTTWNRGMSEKMASLNQRSGNALQEAILERLDSLIIQEKAAARKRRTQRSAPYRLKKKKTMIQVPKDPENIDGDWTEGELKSSSDSDIY
uniref:ORF3 n=1 Tax=Giant panda anellovirus TaxID=2016460 RepID=A0A220IGI8_9VIRU|nr:ORF3 [Giant panda anellovirus]USZ80603.1 ORF3 [Tick-associated anellovirus 7]